MARREFPAGYPAQRDPFGAAGRTDGRAGAGDSGILDAMLRIEWRLYYMQVALAAIEGQVNRIMAISDDFKAALAGFIASVDQLVAIANAIAQGNGAAISAADAQAAIDALNAEKAKVDAAVAADAPPAAPAP